MYVWTRENKRQDTCQIFGYAPKYRLGRGNRKSLGRAALKQQYQQSAPYVNKDGVILNSCIIQRYLRVFPVKWFRVWTSDRFAQNQLNGTLFWADKDTRIIYDNYVIICLL